MAITSNFLVGAAGLAVGGIQAVKSVASFVPPLQNMFSKTGLPAGGEATAAGKANAQFLNTTPKDWRVKLSLPTSGAYTSGQALLAPMTEQGGTGGLVFPYTPTISISHAANYNPIDTIHSNYQFMSYESSKVEAITINGKFYCEDAVEARYWVAAVHYLRSVTKMHFGDTSDAGAPPPVVKLNGYGDYVFNNVPVVVKSFTVDLPDDVDYIATGISGGATGGDGAATANKVSYAPVRSSISVVVQPIYSREQVRKFSLDSFVSGNYIFDGKGYI